MPVYAFVSNSVDNNQINEIDLMPEDNNGTDKVLKRLKNLYNKGDILSLEDLLGKYQPHNNVGETAKLFYQARIAIRQEEASDYYKTLIEKFPETKYAQKALYELAKIALLERSYSTSRNYLKRISSNNQDKNYLLATVNLNMSLFPEAIHSAEKFISESNDEKKIEIAYLTIVEAHILNHHYEKAMKILTKMHAEAIIRDNGSIVTFKEGYCLEMMDQISDAVSKYRHVITQYPYTESSLQAERRLYNLTIADKISHAEMSITSPLPERADETQTDLSIRTTSDLTDKYFIQVNAFSNSKNADNHSRDLKISGFDNIIIPKIISEQQLFIVAVGPYKSRSEAMQVQKELKSSLNLDSFIIQNP